MANCYLFNPASELLSVSLNGTDWPPIYAADPSLGYQPQSLTIPIVRFDNGDGGLSIADSNYLMLGYPEDSKQNYGPYVFRIAFAGLDVSVDADLIIYAGRSAGASGMGVTVMNTQGFVLPAVFLDQHNINLAARSSNPGRQTAFTLQGELP
ncbi:hypothetical protein Jab_2c14020 [Janthinobacterium sp. HH01]|uniref:hypothetical protein n=1 Tax=Janthinobacterium sp. HH01 TaxID=1198452 RepID=UPI0002AEA52A|nr:hypothetical protein [Janthinobacterium sp. HH01]ELX09336.1 hypothetical protein Jab_2c14020 [Janthinobacterium sp. HH01]